MGTMTIGYSPIATGGLLMSCRLKLHFPSFLLTIDGLSAVRKPLPPVRRNSAGASSSFMITSPPVFYQ
ncbi:hypothetical protein HAX54_044103, partial [Datura stramonium]|nr:hypothetical protein [Datura stramonium]